MAGDKQLKDSMATLIELDLKPNIKFWEHEVTPLGIKGGGAIPQTSLRNEEWRTKWPKALKEATDIPVSAGWAPEVYTDILEIMQENQLITVRHSDGTGVRFWGWLEEFVPQKGSEGNKPMAELLFCVSNLNNDDEETGPELIDT